MERIRERCQREFFELEASLPEIFEDHLGVALIRSGDSVIIMNEEALRFAEQ